jgi:hypothetical protein
LAAAACLAGCTLVALEDMGTDAEDSDLLGLAERVANMDEHAMKEIVDDSGLLRNIPTMFKNRRLILIGDDITKDLWYAYLNHLKVSQPGWKPRYIVTAAITCVSSESLPDNLFELCYVRCGSALAQAPIEAHDKEQGGPEFKKKCQVCWSVPGVRRITHSFHSFHLRHARKRGGRTFKKSHSVKCSSA